MNTRKSKRNINRRKDYSRKDYGCENCEIHDCKGCEETEGIESTSGESDVERWIATLSDVDESYSTPVAGSCTEGTIEDLTSTDLGTVEDLSSTDFETTNDITSTDLTLTEVVDYPLESSPSAMADLQNLISEEVTTADDIVDHWDEYDMKSLRRIEDIDAAATRMEGLRTKFRSIHNKLKILDDEYEKNFSEHYKLKLDGMKCYIKDLKLLRSGLLDKDDQIKKDAQKIRLEKSIHLKESFSSCAGELEKIFIVDAKLWSREKDEDVEKRRSELPHHLKSVQALADILMDFMNSSSDRDSVERSKIRYDRLIQTKIAYSSKLDSEVKTRELDKRKKFNKSKFEIKLSKFKGYTGIDYYTFKSDFEKLYLEDTPTENLPDILKNNFLENPALLLVKHVRDIDEIWERLKSAYGDTKIMLSKKTADLGKLDEVLKSSDPEKLIEGLSKTINLMRDLMYLATEHDITEQLYYGNATTTVHSILGKSRLRKWLIVVCEKDIADGKDHWEELLKFLEKEMKVCQKELVLTPKARPSSPPRERKNEKRGNASHQNGGSSNNDTANSCFICGANDHVQTPGYNGKKLTQYYVCKKFIEMNCKQRFDFLKEKNLCYQCLFPGANLNDGKHKEGRCQRDFTCKHDSHAKFTKKKHVLVCDEHKHTVENQTLLDDYKRRFVLRDDLNIPSISKSIIIHHISSSDDSSEDESKVLALKHRRALQKTSRDSKPSIQKHVHFPDEPTVESTQSTISNPLAAITDHSSNATKQPVNTINQSSHEVADNKVKIPEAQASFNSNQQDEVVFSDVEDEGIYVLQRICIDNQEYNIFFDSGCKSFVTNFDAVKRLGEKRAFQLRAGPIQLEGVGGMKMETPHGYYGIKLPVVGGEALFSGLCLDLITQPFPLYPLKGDVEKDICSSFALSGGDPTSLPTLEPSVGGVTHFMFGAQYNRYFPEEVFRMPSGLSIYRSCFQNSSGGYGVVGGTHKVFTEVEKWHNFNRSEFISSQLKIFHNGCQINPDVRMLGFRNCYEDEFNHYTKSDEYENSECIETSDNDDHNVYVNNSLKRFYESQNIGSEIQYRCPKCRACHDCKNCEEEVSIREEVEQAMLEDSVHVDLDNNSVYISLPLLADPEVKLSPNREVAEKVYRQQLKKLKNSPEDKQSIITAEKKLHDLGYVAYVHELSEENQKFLNTNPIQNYFPWRIAWKPNSPTTPCRPVFDASMSTQSGFGLNDIIPKGINNLNKLLEMFLRFRIHVVAFHNDINKMYNGLKLLEAYWVLQRYLFHPNLDPELEPLQKVIMTAIYGVKSSGNQAGIALRKLAEKFKIQFPKAYEVITKDHFVDDCLSGASSIQKAYVLMDQIQLILGYGGFTLKEFTISGKPPDKSLTVTDGSRDVAGHKWWPEQDLIGFNVKELNFARKTRGRKTNVQSEVPKKLTRRICCSKVGEIFDMAGLLSPITATWKLDLHELVTLNLAWDDSIPENLRPVWETTFKQMAEIKDLRYQRAVVPADAANLDIETLEFGDASRVLVCVAVYVRFQLKNNSYSCQLLLGKTRLVPDGMSQPRAELYAAVVNAHTGEVVRRALTKHQKRRMMFSDSQVALHWFTNDSRVLKQWVRNRCIEVRRLSDLTSWRFVRSEHNIADIGTRRCVSMEVISSDSTWINGFEWMKEDRASFPCMTVEELKPTNQTIELAKVEMIPSPEVHNVNVRDELLERYRYSNYVIDPNRHRFQTVIRVLGIVFRYVRTLYNRIKMKPESIQLNALDVATHIFIPDEDIESAQRYFFQKATKEVKEFLKPIQYEKISKESNGVLYYVGRVLPEDTITIVGRATQIMKDLQSTTFCVPLTDKNSPIAYSLVNDVHWNDKTARHCGVETTCRYVLKQMYIIQGRELVKRIKKSCNLCKYLEKRALCVPMGPISKFCTMIAPAYYISQVDIAGPFNAYSYHNKRATIKIWLVVFCCCTTSATNIKTMEDYSTTAFIQSFTRFACDMGYPKRLLTDEGSQLIKGCNMLKLDFQDLKFRLHHDVKVDLDTCPVGGHNMHGKVERRIRHIKESLEKSISNERLGILQWETIAAITANCINNLPLANRGEKADLENLDLITPNRLLLGRNNDRSPVGNMSVTESYDKIISSNARIFDSWFENWLITHVPQLMDQPKWFKVSHDLKEGDIVLFLKNESEISSTYQYGIIESVYRSRDGLIRKALVRYRNHNEQVDRTTFRAARGLVVIHGTDEINIMQELGEIACQVDAERRNTVPK